MQRKIFIAINLDEKTKKFIRSKMSKWEEKLSLHWTEPENLHLTLVYLGFVSDEQLGRICEDLRETLQKQEVFDLEMNLFCWGPNDKKPKMAWLKGGQNSRLSSLRNKIENSVFDFEIDKKDFSPHITIGRIKRLKNKEKLPKFEEKTKIILPVSGIDVMESILEGGRRKYLVMESIELL